MAREKTQTILVSGDVTIDWLQACQESQKSAQNYWQAKSARIYPRMSGAAQMGSLVEAVLQKLPGDPKRTVIKDTDVPRNLRPGTPGIHHVYTLWRPYPYMLRSSSGLEKLAWRIDQFLGLERRRAAPGLEAKGQGKTNLQQADVIVLEDLNLGFRDDPSAWPAALSGHKGWVILNMSQPVAQGKLWEQLISTHSERLVVITSARNLRATAIQVSQGISWERTAQDVTWELTYNPAINALSQAAHLVVSFNCAGAIHLGKTSRGSQAARLFFDPSAMEGDWERQFPGDMIGYSACLTAAITRQVLLDPHQPDTGAGIQSGVAATRLLHQEGFGQRGSTAEQAGLEFPYKTIAQAASRAERPLAEADIQDPAGSLLTATPGIPRVQRGYWTILEDRYEDRLESVARQVVLEGSKGTLRQVPVGKFGALVTVDRREIEALNGIQRLITEYCCTPQKKPLSIAVFGPPGSGKSFGVEQVAKSALGEISILSFNLSQFRQPEALLDALHQVRDAGLSDKIPLVFWDEFDTSLDGQPLGWLRYFLAPMQDGAFQEGQIMHPIGRSIFVFAGGTSPRMDMFGNDLEEDEQRAAKLPDFVSRLKGFLNVLGPNPIEGEGADVFYILRRALILRSILERNVPQVLSRQEGKLMAQIDPGLLRAFLLIGGYRHGVRSMESLVLTSTLSGKNAFERSSLPPEEQLNLHVNAAEFLALMQMPELEGALLERLAEAAHDVFCEGLKAQGFKHGQQTDMTRRVHSSLVAYGSLSEDEKEQNRLNVRDIPAKLALAGYVMRPAKSNEPPLGFPGPDLEMLAESEHERWLREKQAAGWKEAPQTDKARKLHQSQVPWEQLPEAEKEKDRMLVRGIPIILARAGYAVEKAGGNSVR